MQPVDFFRSRIDTMINLSDPLAVLSTRLPWNQIEAAIVAKFEHQNRSGQILKSEDMFGTSEVVVGGGGRSNAGRPKLPIRLMVSLLYLKNTLLKFPNKQFLATVPAETPHTTDVVHKFCATYP